MSYLAMSAAPIDNENNHNQNNNNEAIINKKRQTYNSHTKTQKQRAPSNDFNPQKVNSVLKSIHNLSPDDDNDLGNYSPNGNAKHSEDFKPLNPYEFPDKPVSMGGERTKKPEGMTNIETDDLVPKPVDDDDMQLQDLHSNFMNDAQVRDYYRKLVPNYSNKNSNENNKNYYSSQSSSQNLSQNHSVVTDTSNQVLIEKLNYMINLLEEQQDQKTNSVTEEVVLYSFLGVFIIFVVDSFARVGKYTR
jgi:hypothetical protein